MKSWKITLKNGKVLHESNYDHLHRGSIEWVIASKRLEKRRKPERCMWKKKFEMEEVEVLDTQLIIPVENVLMAEWAEIKEKKGWPYNIKCDSPKATDPAKPSGGIIGWAKPINQERDKFLYNFGIKTPKLSKKGKKMFKKAMGGYR